MVAAEEEQMDGMYGVAGQKNTSTLAKKAINLICFSRRLYESIFAVDKLVGSVVRIRIVSVNSTMWLYVRFGLADAMSLTSSASARTILYFLILIALPVAAVRLLAVMISGVVDASHGHRLPAW